MLNVTVPQTDKRENEIKGGVDDLTINATDMRYAHGSVQSNTEDIPAE
jgi:hypothetical protein